VLVKLIPKWNSKINVHQQEHIAKAVIAYSQVMDKIISYEASELCHINQPLSNKDKTTP